MSTLTVSSNNLTELYSHFNEFRLQQKFHDVVIQVGDCSFSCHRVILASALKYFRNMFSERSNQAYNEEEIVDAEDFELLLTYIYSGSVSFEKDHSYRLLRISHQLGLIGFENLFIYMIDTDKIPLDTVFDILTLLTTIKDENLEAKFLSYVAKNFTIALKYPEFVHISGDHLLKILNHPSETKNSSETLEFLAKWVHFEPSKQKTKLLPYLLNAATHKPVPNERFLKAINQMADLVPSSMCENGLNIEEQLADDDKTAMMSKNSHFDTDEEQERDRQNYHTKSLPFVFYAVGRYCKSLNKNVNLYKFLLSGETQFWKPLHQLGHVYPYESLTAMKSVLVNEAHWTLISRIGVRDNTHFSHSYIPFINQEYQLYKQAQDFKFIPEATDSLSDYTFGTSITSMGTSIYIYNYNKSVIFNCRSNQYFQMLENGLKKTMYPNLVSNNSSLYLLGGSSPNLDVFESGKLFQHWDEREGKWMQMPRFTYHRSGAASCINDGVLYVSGGICERWIECFDFRASKWYKLEKLMPISKFDHTLLAYNNQLWFFGGQKFRRTGKGLEKDRSWYSYNIIEDSWSEIFKISRREKCRDIIDILDVVNI